MFSHAVRENNTPFCGRTSPMTENRRILLNIVATYGRSLYSLVLGLLCGRWALMALGEVDYGLSGLVGGLTVYIGFFNSVLATSNARFYAFSVGAAKTASDKNAALEECRRWFNTALSVHSVLPVFLMIIGYPLGAYAITHWLTIPADRIGACIWVWRFVCISCFVGMVNVPYNAMYRAKQYIAELTVYSFVTVTLRAFVLHYMITHPRDWLARYSAWTCLMAVLPSCIIAARASFIFPECRINFKYMWDMSRLKRLGGFASWQFIGVLCGMLRTSGINIVINKLFGPAMNAAKNVGTAVQGHCNTLASSMQGAFVPVVTQACGAGDYAKMNKFALRTCKFNVALSMIFVIPLALELPEVMRLWLKTPPAFSTGLCYCAMAFHLASCCTTGHMVVVNAVGKIALYNGILGTISIFTLPIAVAVGLVWRNVYAVMASVVAMECINSIGRVVFARIYGGTSIRAWVGGVFVPLAIAVFLCALVGYVPQVFFEASFARVVLTAACCEAVFLPLMWFVILSAEERAFVKEKVGIRFFQMIGKRK